MKFCYANRRHTLYPDTYDNWNVGPDAYTDAFVGKAAELGFDGFEIGYPALGGGDESALRAFAKRLRDAGVPAVTLRAGGSLTAAQGYADNTSRLERVIRAAAVMGAEVVNGAISAPARFPGKPINSPGQYRSQDASREAMIYDYERLAEEFQKACDQAAGEGITISVEVHQNSLVDNSWSAQLLHRLVERDNFGINPDLGNIFWTYDVPEETTEQAITALAPIAVYWHCKNMFRVYHPENERAVYIRVPLPDGEIDYRFAISAMIDAGYEGYMAIEGAVAGDQFHADAKSISYSRAIAEELEAR